MGYVISFAGAKIAKNRSASPTNPRSDASRKGHERINRRRKENKTEVQQSRSTVYTWPPGPNGAA